MCALPRLPLFTFTMSAAAVLSQLKSLLEKTEQLKGKLSKICPTDDQWDSLNDLSLRLSGASKAVQDKVQVLQETRSERAWKESWGHCSKAQALRGDLFATGRLKQPVIFRRNIVTIFEGPKVSKFDSEDVKIRKESTRKRCELIRSLSPDGLISWTLSFAPTLWAGGSMASDVFACLLDDVEPELVQMWPLVIRETLHLLMEDEELLRQSPEYDVFLKAIDDPSRKPVHQRKRRRIDDENKHRNGERERVARTVNTQVPDCDKAWPSQGFGRISALLNHDSDASAIRVIQFEKQTLQQIVLERPTNILGDIWFGSPPGFVPFVSLRLSGELRDIIKLSGQDVLMPEPSRDTSGTFTGVYSIKLECFRQLIQRDGFGAIFWNEYGGEAFVAMQVMDKELIAAFIQASQTTVKVLPRLDNVTIVNTV
uniref:Uncharacterized protein n=1 Tax=Photinus pyralis TaxID=7054 RepID=A0A1Y1K5F7_PHOPY